MPWLFSVMEGLARVFRKKLSLNEKVYLIQLSESTNSVGNTLAYNADRECTCDKEIIEYLRWFQKDKDALALIRFWENMKKIPVNATRIIKSCCRCRKKSEEPERS